MKVIFLDIDGVLINREACRSGFGKVDPECVVRLNELLKLSDAKIVLSSCWRIGRTVQQCKDLLAKWGVNPDLVIGRTENDWNVIRGIEIQQWLDEFKPESFVIIDDDTDMGDLLPRLVKTKFEVGLTYADCETALALLVSPTWWSRQVIPEDYTL